ncbi:SAM-dependent methyltransferase [Rothia sp. HMSC072B04]|uniref:SAM-dependent methyltransferase related to tRNA (Uracil-5-)-methyltransferase n=1 Tax=Rothia mucilaginosa (strain DY-18) TaxID=680646 RepID=D2NTU2_ROTMD|nr:MULTISPECIES: TRAM domain-containing protein [Rothia]MDU2571848.1 class I SAM-dependent RNA methyltransferase [Rothia mucilaginosa]OFM97805.1 SAM-dependent methyltransferase [Rothia sp. HMSC072B03]OFN72263.1 SAM-dependent methyltransferase [Rothia sp. HMSC078H08]OFN74450.1 SAM-dependent methyltransferase [Rothia sp. HMSC071B01]OFP77287.1 SAM-dependent methyltransferase [Rothia sp. HMSC066G07]
MTHTATTPAASKKVDGYSVGQTLTVTCEAPAHGGAFVARTEQGVIFVRHGIVGEQAEVRITAIGPKRRFYFADVISVPVPSLARRAHPWIQADALATEEERAAATGVPELLGGMEYGHINLDEQRRYKTDIVRTQINRLGGLPLESPLLTNLMVEELPLRDNNEGLSWRSRVRYNVTKVRAHNSEEQNGGKKSPAVTWRVGMHPYRASQPVPVVDFPLAATELRNLQLEQLNLRGVREVEATVSSRGRVLLQFIVDPRFSVEEVAKDIEQQASDAWGLLAKRKISLFFTPQSTSNGKPKRRRPGSAHSPYRRVPEGDQLLGAGLRSVTEEVTFGSRRFSYQVSAGGFWQIHRAAPSTMVGTMLTMLRPQEGECTLDLYAGAGLFTAALADAVGATGTVVSIEGSPVTHKDARSNFAPDGCSRTENSADTRIEVIRGDVARHLVDLKTALEFGEIPAIDAVVLDPSREGANRTTLERLDALDPKRILYVACDPASLGRDTGILRELGWDMVQLRAFDMYPNTHHVETVALFERAPAKPRPRRRRTK